MASWCILIICRKGVSWGIEMIMQLGSQVILPPCWLANFLCFTGWQQILKAVRTIHDERIVHSDLKPANFMLVRGELKLIDFGIARAIQNDTTNIVKENQVCYQCPSSIFNCLHTYCLFSDRQFYISVLHLRGLIWWSGHLGFAKVPCRSSRFLVCTDRHIELHVSRDVFTKSNR